MKKLSLIDWQWVAGIIVLLAISRLIPHPPNFTPLGAMAIIAGASIKDLRLAIVIPLAAMMLSDIWLGLHSSLLYVYAAMTAIVVMSRWLLPKISVTKIAVVAVAAAVVFFLITNFAAWLSHQMYPQTFDGLMQAYLAGIPFFRNTLLSNLFFTAIGFYALLKLPKDKVVHT